MTPETLAALTSSALGAVGGVLAYFQSRRANARAAALESTRLALDERKATWDRYDHLVDQLQEEVERLRESLRIRDEMLQRLRRNLDEMATQMESLRAENMRLITTIARLKAVLVKVTEVAPVEVELPPDYDSL